MARGPHGIIEEDVDEPIAEFTCHQPPPLGTSAQEEQDEDDDGHAMGRMELGDGEAVLEATWQTGNANIAAEREAGYKKHMVTMTKQEGPAPHRPFSSKWLKGEEHDGGVTHEEHGHDDQDRSEGPPEPH